MKIKNLTTAALLATGTLVASLSAYGQTYGPIYASYPNDLVMGFQNQAGAGTEDYIINLGPAASIVGQSTVVDLSSDFTLSDFNAVLRSSSSMFGGVIGSANIDNSGTANTADVFLTQLRAGGAGNPATPGSAVTQQMSRSQDNLTYSAISGGLVTPAVGEGALDTTKSWESDIEPGALNSGNQGAFESQTGLNPDSSVGASSVLYEDLWESSSSTLSGTKPFTYLGYFTLDLTGGTPKLTFTSLNVPASLSAPTIVSVSKSGNTVTVVSSNALSSHSYQLQYSTSLTSPITWIPVGSAVVASGTSVTNMDTTAAGAQRFYRVQAQ